MSDSSDREQQLITVNKILHNHFQAQRKATVPAFAAAQAEIIDFMNADREAAVLEGRIDELRTHGDQWRVWEDDTTDVKLADVINWYDLRIAELQALKQKDGDGAS